MYRSINDFRHASPHAVAARAGGAARAGAASAAPNPKPDATRARPSPPAVSMTLARLKMCGSIIRFSPRQNCFLTSLGTAGRLGSSERVVLLVLNGDPAEFSELVYPRLSAEAAVT